MKNSETLCEKKQIRVVQKKRKRSFAFTNVSN